jgi:hypothetical protein
VKIGVLRTEVKWHCTSVRKAPIFAGGIVVGSRRDGQRQPKAQGRTGARSPGGTAPDHDGSTPSKKLTMMKPVPNSVDHEVDFMIGGRLVELA